MSLLAAAARRSSTPHRLLISLHHLLSTLATTTTASCYDPTAQFLPHGHHRGLSLPASLRRDALLALVRLLKTSPQCHISLHVLCLRSGDPSSPFAPLDARFAAAFRLAASAPALRPFAAILLAALLPSSAWDLLSWSSAASGSASTRYGTLRLALHAFLAAGMAAEALEVLARIRTSGNTPSLSALATLLRLLFRSGEVQAAWKVFEEMTARGPRPSLAIFNAMILGFCHRGMVRVGSGLLGIMGKFHVVPDVCSFNILIKGHCVFGRSEDAFKLFDEMRMSGIEPTVVTYNILVDIRCREGRMEDARKMFDEMVQVGIEANTVTFNVLIDGYAKVGQIDKADAALAEMKSRGLVPDCWTFNILAAGINKFGKAIKLAHSIQSLNETFGSQVSTDGLDMWICKLCWDGRLDDAWELLLGAIGQSVPVGVAGFNALIAAYSKDGFHQAAFQLYRIMNNLGLTPSSPTFSYLIMGLCKQGMLNEAQMLLEHMISKGYCASTSFTIYLDASFRAGNAVGALKCWDDLKKIGLQPDFVAFSAYINGLCRLGYAHEAYDAFIEMKRKELVPNNITYNSLISALCRAGNVSEALALEQEMMQNGLVPDVYTSNILIDGFSREGNFMMANKRFSDMCANGLTPDVVSYNTIINACYRAHDTRKALVLMNRMLADPCEPKPDIFTYNIWMHSLCSNHMLNQAGKVLDELVAMGCTPDSVTYNTLMDGICNDVLERAMILTGRLIKMAFQPNTITVNVFLSHFCKQGFGERALMWAEKLREDSFVFDDATRNIIDWAHKEMENDHRANNIDIDKCLFLDFLIFMTYETIRITRYSNCTHASIGKSIDPASSNIPTFLDNG
ncbi:hypothetical protein QOZ80_1AG0005760 [Eleusine coracana subsp. coracana]|nr:hypothetical protein QOZ80_1AG0005760 [Eleusine coracana subsp. coracana]